MEGKPLRVYLVENSPILRQLLHELLSAAGAHVVGQSGSAQAAISEIKALRPQLVIVDIALESGTGFDVLKALADNPDRRRPVCMVLSNHSSAPYRTAARRLGVQYFFDKSSEIVAMLKVITSMALRTSRRNGSDR